jgi:hypothetical protein
LGRRGTPPCTAMGRLLVVHHTTSPRLQVLLEAVLSGAGDEAIQDVTVLARSALAATAIDVLGADGYLLGTPANLGYMSGALKHFLDQIYYPCLEATVGRPYGLYVHGDSDTTGARAGGRGDHPGGPPGLLGAWRRDRGRLNPVCRLTWSAPIEAVLP